MPLLDHTLQGLLNTHYPRLASHLHAAGVHVSMFATQWLLTVFAYSFPFGVGAWLLGACCVRRILHAAPRRAWILCCTCV